MAAVGQLVLWNNTGETEVTEYTSTGLVYTATGTARFAHAACVPWVSGGYYDASSSVATASWSTDALTLNRVHTAPFYVPNDVTISEVAINVTTLIAASLAKVGLYDMGTDFKPNALIWEGATNYDTSATGEESLTGLSIGLLGGRWYFHAVISNSTGVNITAATTMSMAPLGYSSHTDATRRNQYYKDPGSFTLPNPFGTPSGILAGIRRVTLRVA